MVIGALEEDMGFRVAQIRGILLWVPIARVILY